MNKTPYPLIIVGAGASFDYMNNLRHHPVGYRDTDLDKYRPPLTNDLFDTTRFYEFIEKYPDVSNLASSINNQLSGNRGNFEECLTEIKNIKTKQNEERYRQLVALRFYLADLFFNISERYFKTVNNYADLLQQVKDLTGKACFVNFNYDLLLEKSMTTSEFKFADDYLSGDIKIIKIHGACNWFYKRRVVGSDSVKTSYDYSLLDAKNIVSSEGKHEIVIQNVSTAKNLPSEEAGSKHRKMYLPAIALPIQNKNNFVCPDGHITALERSLNETDKILIIGWRGQDPFLMNLLTRHFAGKEVPIAIVGGKNVEDTLKNFSGGLKTKVKNIAKSGFTAFMTSGGCEGFLNS